MEKAKNLEEKTYYSIQIITDPDPGGPKGMYPKGSDPERGLAESRPKSTPLVLIDAGLAAVLRIQMRDSVPF
jgi:hypothetical protein